ncbi:hypothetical protein K9L67_02980 [Candidatus Woesearchaeota archaeon]|nr:hypothetical protein [Candidatus Woesearchaeota archaeon]MCF7901165.1 hypothetical protein [Candidatus Woesearchaeota archaeon]MCF8013821.1 hypothetical protein [Candidatus Woesearchaeota archaeon]
MADLTVTVVVYQVFGIIPSILSIVFIILLIKEIFGVGYGGGKGGKLGGSGGEAIKDGARKIGSWFKNKRDQIREKEEKWDAENTQLKNDLLELGNVIATLRKKGDAIIEKIKSGVNNLKESFNHNMVKELFKNFENKGEKYKTFMSAVHTLFAELKKEADLLTTNINKVKEEEIIVKDKLFDDHIKKLLAQLNDETDEKINKKIAEIIKNLKQEKINIENDFKKDIPEIESLKNKIIDLLKKGTDLSWHLNSKPVSGALKSTSESNLVTINNELIEEVDKFEKLWKQHSNDERTIVNVATEKIDKLMKELSNLKAKITREKNKENKKEDFSKNKEDTKTSTINELKKQLKKNYELISKEKTKINNLMTKPRFNYDALLDKKNIELLSYCYDKKNNCRKEIQKLAEDSLSIIKELK